MVLHTMKSSTGYSKRKIVVKTFFSFIISNSTLNNIFTNSSDNFELNILTDPFWSHILSAISELFGLIVLLYRNILGISGIQQHKPYQLVPWLVVYIIGIISSYIGSFLLFCNQDSEGSFKLDGFLPIGLEVFFHLCWIFVKNAFNIMKSERSVDKFCIHVNKFLLQPGF